MRTTSERTVLQSTLLRSTLLACLLVATGCAATGTESTTEHVQDVAVTDAADTPTTAAPRQYTYSWQYRDADDMAPRGGTTQGVAVELAREPSDAWRALQAPGSSARERDRRAILAMAGPHRATFDFVETVGFTENYSPARPYRSWGTEYVYVLEDSPEFISLQHILVMFIEGEDGTVSDPIVVKHWRQDWTYEAETFHEFVGHDTWRRTGVDDATRAGGWSQTVWQVDDSPRYASFGHWRHEPGQSIWEGQPTLRPLPRREFSIRDDYDALRAVNRHIVTPTGWVHEEQNEKIVFEARSSTDPNDQGTSIPTVIARESGLNRYERIVGHDWSAGDAYWARTAGFWREVRDTWDRIHETYPAFVYEARGEQGMLFSRLFEYAATLDGADDFDRETARAFVVATIEAHVADSTPATVATRDTTVAP